MKQVYFIITISLCLLPLTGMQAQRTLQIEAIPGQLAEQLTEEQKKEVGVLTLTGSLEDADFYFMRDGLPALATLHMEDADADTIPSRAFYQKESLRNVFLPKTVKYVAEDAFNTGNEVMVHVTGTYPGESALIGPNGNTIADCGSRSDAAVTAEIDMGVLERFRRTFPILKDADKFNIG